MFIQLAPDLNTRNTLDEIIIWEIHYTLLSSIPSSKAVCSLIWEIKEKYLLVLKVWYKKYTLVPEIFDPVDIMAYIHTYMCKCASPMALQVNKMLAMQEIQETRVRSLGQDDPLEKEMAAQSNILAWEIPWTEEPGRLQSSGWQSWTWLSYSNIKVFYLYVDIDILI